MGTVLRVEVYARDSESARDMAEKAARLARHWDDVLTTWRPDGELAQLNASAGAGWQRVSGDLALALDQMLAFSKATGGAFDPAVGGLVRAIRSDGTPGDAVRATLAEALSRRPGEASLAAGIEIDAGGFGKGLALDRMAVALRSLGAEAALLDFGGSSQFGFGAFPKQPPMMVAVGLNDGEMHGVVELADRALSTSRAPAAAGAGPIVDPRFGQAVSEPRLATVAAPTATLAEVWSTALVVLGRPGIARAVAHGVEVLYEDTNGLVVTPGFPLVTRERPPR